MPRTNAGSGTAATPAVAIVGGVHDAFVGGAILSLLAVVAAAALSAITRTRKPLPTNTENEKPAERAVATATSAR